MPEFKRPRRRDRDLNICACGDYRRDHEGGIGHCKMPNDLCHGFMTCDRFRLHQRSRSEPGEAHGEV